MLDLVIQGKSALSALNVLGAVLFWGIICVALGFAGLFLVPRQRTRPLWRGLFGAMLVCGVALLALPPAIFLYHTYSKKIEVLSFRFDLKHPPGLAALDQSRCAKLPYGQNASLTNCVFEGDIGIILDTGNGTTAFEHARTMWASGVTDEIQSFGFLSAPYNLSDAAEQAGSLLAIWQGPREQFDEWRRKADSESELTYPVLAAPANTGLPRMQVIVKRITNPEYAATPWFLRVNVNWGETDTPSVSAR